MQTRNQWRMRLKAISPVSEEEPEFAISPNPAFPLVAWKTPAGQDGMSKRCSNMYDEQLASYLNLGHSYGVTRLWDRRIPILVEPDKISLPLEALNIKGVAFMCSRWGDLLHHAFQVLGPEGYLVLALAGMGERFAAERESVRSALSCSPREGRTFIAERGIGGDTDLVGMLHYALPSCGIEI